MVSRIGSWIASLNNIPNVKYLSIVLGPLLSSNLIEYPTSYPYITSWIELNKNINKESYQ